MRSFVLALVLLLAPMLGGCTLVGLGIGAAVPAYETQDRGSVEPGKLSSGDRVRIVAKPRSGEGVRRISGTYRGVEEDEITVVTVSGERQVAMDDIEKLSVRRGNRAAEGALIGLLLDGLIVGTAIAASSWNHYR